jgi:hypothetical protein
VIRCNCNELQDQLGDVLIRHNGNVLFEYEPFVLCDLQKNSALHVNVGTKMRKFPLRVMDIPVRVLGSVRILAHALTGPGNCI